MSERRRLHHHAWFVVKRALLALFLVQVVTAAVLVVSDSVRKRRNKPAIDVRSLTVAPQTVDVDHSAATLFANGADLFDDMIAAIEAARERVLFETYIWKADATGHRFKQAVIDAADRGVQVFVVYDTFANLVVPRSFKRFPPSIHVLEFPLYTGGMPSLRTMARDHRKILVVDGAIGYVGGFNIGDDYATQWRDTHIRIDGPSVWDLENSFIDFWNVYRDRDDPDQPSIPDSGARDWDVRIRAHRNSPGEMVFPIRGMYLEALDRAVSHIYITQAYFVPDRHILGRLIAAARRGVDVRVLVPERSNHVIADVISRGFYSTMLENGVRIMLYERAMVHAKTATIDGKWSTIGTANIDRLSFVGNYEINLEIIDDDLAKQMELMFERDLDNARELTLEKWSERRFLSRFSEVMIGPFRPLV